MKAIIKDKIDSLPPNIKRVGMLVIAGLVVVFIVSLFSTKKEPRKKNQQETIRSVLTDRDTRSLSIDSIGGQLEMLTRQLEEMSRAQARLDSDLKRTKESTSEIKKLDSVINKLERKMDKFDSAVDVKLEKIEENFKNSGRHTATTGEDEGDDVSFPNAASTPYKTITKPEDYFNVNTPSGLSIPSPSNSDSGEADAPAKPKMEIVMRTQAKADDSDTEDEKERDYYIPLGSIISGVLINGMDAPTGQGARREPFPATVRVKAEAILPNRFRADIKECFISVAGYGDLSSERAYLRSEAISCIRDDGGVIETSLDGYAVGEDGKAGVRGRLVSKQGPIIAKSLMAGFMSAAGKVFDVNPVPVISTSSTGETQYDKVLSGGALQGAAVSGVGSSLERIAQFYMDMADGMFPVIEVDAVRNIDIILTKGAALKVIGNTAANAGDAK